jgi:hypothetical protein
MGGQNDDGWLIRGRSYIRRPDITGFRRLSSTTNCIGLLLTRIASGNPTGFRDEMSRKLIIL